MYHSPFFCHLNVHRDRQKEKGNNFKLVIASPASYK